MYAFDITICIQEYCILKAARAFLVFKALESLGDVIKSSPEVQDIEDEKFDLDLMEESTAITGGMQAKTNRSDEITVKGNAGAAAKKTTKPVLNRSVRVDIEKLDILMNLVSELIISKNGLVSLSATEKNSTNESGFNEQIEYLERVTTNLHESVMKVRMVPIESVVNRFPRMIRDLSKKLNKNIELYMTGEETELDRTVIDEIGDPLMHLLRNAADHGLESNEDRIAAGKSAVGSIFLDAY